MEMSSIQSSQVNFKAQPQAVAQTKPTVVDRIKNMEDGEKLTAALAGLGAIGLGALLYAKGKGHKAQDAVNEVIEQATKPKAADAVVEAGEKVAEEVAEKAARPINLITTSTKITPQKAFDVVDETCGKKAVESAAVFARYGSDITTDEVVQSAIEQGQGISGIKKELTRNLTKAEKKAAKKAVDSSANNARKAITEAQQEVQRQIATAENATRKLETAQARVAKATTAEEVDKAIANLDKKVVDRAAKSGASSEEVTAAQQAVDALKQEATEKKAQIATNLAAKEARKEAAMADPKQLEQLQQGAKTTLNKFIKQKTAHGKMTEKQALEAFIQSGKNDLAKQMAKERLAKLK